jgi:hypothetical protein
MAKGKKRPDIYAKYRRILRMADLKNSQIDEMRKYLGLLAQTICELVWGERILLIYG